MTERLRREIRQERPFRSREQEAFLTVVRTAAVLSDAFEQVLRPSGLTAAQYNVLRILQGSEPDGLCRNDLRDRLITRMPDVTRLLDRMEEAGLVTRRRDAEDRRLVTTWITARGERVLAELDAAVAEEHRRRFASLEPAQLATLVELLDRVRSSI